MHRSQSEKLPGSLQNSFPIRTGLSDFHKPVVAVMKTTYKTLKRKIITYRICKSLSDDSSVF